MSKRDQSPGQINWPLSSLCLPICRGRCGCRSSTASRQLQERKLYQLYSLYCCPLSPSKYLKDDMARSLCSLDQGQSATLVCFHDGLVWKSELPKITQNAIKKNYPPKWPKWQGKLTLPTRTLFHALMMTSAVWYLTINEAYGSKNDERRKPSWRELLMGHVGGFHIVGGQIFVHLAFLLQNLTAVTSKPEVEGICCDRRVKDGQKANGEEAKEA